jgi:hypothetical protein
VPTLSLESNENSLFRGSLKDDSPGPDDHGTCFGLLMKALKD